MIIGGVEYVCLARKLARLSAQEIIDLGVPVDSTLMHATQDCGGENYPGELAGVGPECEGCPVRIVVSVDEAIAGMSLRVREKLNTEENIFG